MVFQTFQKIINEVSQFHFWSVIMKNKHCLFPLFTKLLFPDITTRKQLFITSVVGYHTSESNILFIWTNCKNQKSKYYALKFKMWSRFYFLRSGHYNNFEWSTWKVCNLFYILVRTYLQVKHLSDFIKFLHHSNYMVNQVFIVISNGPLIVMYNKIAFTVYELRKLIAVLFSYAFQCILGDKIIKFANWWRF